MPFYFGHTLLLWLSTQFITAPSRSYVPCSGIQAPLTIEHGHAIRDTMQLPPVDFGNMTELTLAEAINWHDINGTANKAPRIGYT